MIYFLHPATTLGESGPIKSFYQACRNELEQQVGMVVIASEQAARSIQLNDSDALAFFTAQSYSPWVTQVLQAPASAFPIAMAKNVRFPGAHLSHRQSFDVEDELARRGLSQDNSTDLTTVAAAFCRALLAATQPTLCQYKMRIFLSHRRADGEDLARIFHEELLKRVQAAFRDLSAVLVGEDAQEKIEQALVKSDAVIFLETPSAYQSSWIEKELEIALSLNLPIVWISLGEVDEKQRKVYPAREPHFRSAQMEISPSLVDDSLNLAFKLARSSGLRIFDSIHRLQALGRHYQFSPNVEDQTSLVFSVTIPRVRSRYRELPMKHRLQFFGRWPKSEDLENFKKEFHAAKSDYDAGLLLGPIPGQLLTTLEGPVCIDSAEEYVTEMEQLLSKAVPPVKKCGVIISGAFPERGLEENPVAAADDLQNLIDAVHAFTRAVFAREGVVIFGTHPTFVPLIFDMARRKRPRDFKQAIHLYVSAAFSPKLEDYEPNATVHLTPKVEPPHAASLEKQERDRLTRNLSLTEMRRQMTGNPRAAALVAIGGKHHRDGLIPGVDEEIELARKAGLPVFLIGSPPGRARQRALDYSTNNWQEKLNPLSPEQNEQLRTSLDYATLAEMVLSAIFINSDSL